MLLSHLLSSISNYVLIITRDALATANQEVLSPEDFLETLYNALSSIDSASYKKACLELKKLEKKKKISEDRRWTRDCEKFQNVKKIIIERTRDNAKKKLKSIITSQTILKDILHRSGKLGKRNTAYLSHFYF